MGTEAFWQVVDAAKCSDKSLDVADHVSVLTAEEIPRVTSNAPSGVS
ncbi:hypothetical protein ABZS68_11460 [Streptomyces sp. NPDC005571]